MSSDKEFISRFLNRELGSPPDMGKMDEAAVKSALNRQEPQLSHDVSFEQIVQDVQDILLAKIAWVSHHTKNTPSDGGDRKLINLAHSILLDFLYPIAVRRPASKICQVHLPHDYLPIVTDRADPGPQLRVQYTKTVTDQWRGAMPADVVEYLHRLRHNIFRSHSVDSLRPELRGGLEPARHNIKGAPETVAVYCITAAKPEQKEVLCYLDKLWAHGWCHDHFIYMLVRSALSSPELFGFLRQASDFRTFAIELDARCKEFFHPSRWFGQVNAFHDFLAERYAAADADLIAARRESRSICEWLRRIFQLAPKVYEILFHLRLSEELVLSPDDRDELRKMDRYYEEIYVDIFTCLNDPLFYVPSVLVGAISRCRTIPDALLTLEFFCSGRVFIPDFIKAEIADALNRSIDWPLPQGQDLLAALHLKLRASLGKGFTMAYDTLHGVDHFQRQLSREDKLAEAQKLSRTQKLSPLSQALLSAVITYGQGHLPNPPSAKPVFIEQQMSDIKLQYILKSAQTLHAIRCGPIENSVQLERGRLVTGQGLFERSVAYIASNLKDLLYGLEVARSVQIDLAELKFIDALCKDTSWYVRVILQDGSVWGLSPWRGPPELNFVKLDDVQTSEELLGGFLLVSAVARALKTARPTDFKGKVTIAMPPEIDEHAGKLSGSARR